MRCLGEAALVDHGHERPQQLSRNVQHAPSPFLRRRILASIRREPSPGKRLPAATIRIMGNVCSIPPESSAAINVAGTLQIGKYCAVRAFVPSNLAQSLRAGEDGSFQVPWDDVASMGHWVRVHGQPEA
jgi:hypothetical protein